MNMHNACLHHRMAQASAALKHLDAMGCTVTGVDLARRQPVLRIARNANRFLRPVMTKRITVDGVRQYTLTAVVDGCLVQWHQTHVTPPAAHQVPA